MLDGPVRPAPGELTDRDASVMKLLWSRWHKALGELAMDVRGPAPWWPGTAYELDGWQRLYLFSRADTIYGGSDEIQLGIIAARRSACPGRRGHDRRAARCRRAGPRPAGRQGRGASPRRPGPGSAARPRGAAWRRAPAGDQRRARRPARGRHDELAGEYGDRVWSVPCDVTSETPCPALIDGAVGQVRPDRRDDQQRRARRHQLDPRDDRRAVASGARHHAERHVPVHQGRAAAAGRPGRRRRGRQQRLGARLAGSARPGPLRGREGRA